MLRSPVEFSLQTDQSGATEFTGAPDIDGDGTLSKGEITLLLPQLHVHLPRDTINSIFSACDADDSGALDFKEFEKAKINSKNGEKIRIIDLGCDDEKISVDYPDYAKKLASKMPKSDNQNQAIDIVDNFSGYAGLGGWRLVPSTLRFFPHCPTIVQNYPLFSTDCHYKDRN